MLGKLNDWALRFAGTPPPWTNVYGLARTLLAVSSLVTLLANDTATLFIPLAMLAKQAPYCDGQAIPGLYCLVENLEVARYIAIILLVVVASGWRPRITGVLHWWVAASLQWSATLLDGGDQVAMNLTLLLVPVTLLDRRRWHWDRPSPPRADSRELVCRLVALSAFVAIRVQVMVIYYVAGVAKYSVDEWADGTALYYWLLHPVFGAPDALRPAMDVVIHSPVLLPLVTWGVLLLEGLLAAGLFMHRRYRPILFCVGALLHVGIAVLHGILTFAVAMEAALILYLLPVSKTLEDLTAPLRAKLSPQRAQVRLPILEVVR